MTPVVVHLQYFAKTSHFDIMPDTTAKTEAIPEILEAYIQTQFGKGKDEREAAVKDVYDIKLLLDLSDDTFIITHDCNNDALCLGIVLSAAETITKQVEAG